MNEFPPDLKLLLQEHVHTPEQLEALLLMAASKGRRMSAETLAEELGISVTAATIALTRLKSHGLLLERIGVPSLFEYGPETEGLKAAVERLEALYQAHRLQVLSVLSQNAATRASADLQTLAEAFVLRGKNG